MSAMLSDIHAKICKLGERGLQPEETRLGFNPNLEIQDRGTPTEEVHRELEGTGILPPSVLGAGPAERAREFARTGPIPSSISTISSSRFSSMEEGTRLRTLEEGHRKTEHQVMKIMEAFEKTSKKLDEQQARIEEHNAKFQEILNAQKMNEIQMKCMAAALSNISRELLRRPDGEAPTAEHRVGDDVETENLDPNLRSQGRQGVNSGLNSTISPGKLVSCQDWNKICEINGSSPKEFPRGNDLSSKPDFQTRNEFYFPLDSDVAHTTMVELMGNSFDFGMNIIRRISVSPLRNNSAYQVFVEMFEGRFSLGYACCSYTDLVELYYPCLVMLDGDLILVFELNGGRVIFDPGGVFDLNATGSSLNLRRGYVFVESVDMLRGFFKSANHNGSFILDPSGSSLFWANPFPKPLEVALSYLRQENSGEVSFKVMVFDPGGEINSSSKLVTSWHILPTMMFS